MPCMAQFSLKQLFIAVTLTAIGFWLLVTGCTGSTVRINALCLLGGTCIGTGIGSLFKRSMHGAIAGAFGGMVVRLALDMIRLLNK